MSERRRCPPPWDRDPHAGGQGWGRPQWLAEAERGASSQGAGPWLWGLWSPCSLCLSSGLHQACSLASPVTLAPRATGLQRWGGAGVVVPSSLLLGQAPSCWGAVIPAEGHPTPRGPEGWGGSWGAVTGEEGAPRGCQRPGRQVAGPRAGAGSGVRGHMRRGEAGCLPAPSHTNSPAAK